MQFPRREADIVGLAQQIARGLTDHPDAFPAVPVPPDDIREILEEYQAARHRGITHRARARQWTQRKQRALARLQRLMAPVLRYAEYAASENPGVVHLIGWGPRRKPRHDETQKPGQAAHLRIVADGADWVSLVWDPPFDGGSVAAYRVQCRRRLRGDWTDVGSSVETAITLRKQETGIELEYRVIAMNAAGEGVESATVRAVL